MQQIYNLGPHAWLFGAFLLSVVVNIVLASELLACRAPEPVQSEPTNQAAFALAVFGLVGAVMVLALGFAAYKCSDDLLALLAIIFGLGLLSDLKSGADKIAFRQVEVTERPAEQKNIRVGDHQSLVD